MTTDNGCLPGPNLGEIANRFLETMPTETREKAQAEVWLFVKWFGAGRALDDLSIPEVGLYGEQVLSPSAEPEKRVDTVKAFLTYAHRQKWSKTNLSVHVRFRKTAAKTGLAARHTSSTPVRLTQQGHAELASELGRLIAERPAIAQELEKARADRDFRENAPLDAAREHQAHVEARIKELEAILKSAAIIDEAQGIASKIGIGDTVWLEDLSSGEETSYTLVSSREANPVRGKISTASPTGKILLGKAEGSCIEVVAPAGTVRYRIKKVAQQAPRT